ncbi:MAG TPA: ATP-binding protein [Polyangiaceae bacterium]|nr:ATP-binding protein [Polyangiaceae bacterium]
MSTAPSLPGGEGHDEKTGDASFIADGGEAGALIRAIDWRSTHLGPASQWPQSLRTSLSLCVSSRFPIALYWGREFVMLYNDALLPMVGANKHPWAMGRPAFEVLPEIRDVIGPMLQRVVDTGEAIWSEDLMLPLVRGDAPEEGYFTFTYSPIRDESGGVGGVFCAVLETTDKVIGERRLRLLNALADATQARTPAEACALAAAHIARARDDVPFALLYLVDEASHHASLVGTANIESGTPRAPASIQAGDDAPWSFDFAEAPAMPRFVALEDGPGGARGAVILPIERAGGGRPLGFVVVGLSPLLRQSSSYDRFHHLLSASISQAVSNAAAHEAETQRSESLAELDRAKTTFFGNVSHEFRTPLTLMLAPIEDMLAMPEGARVERRAIELLHRNALRLLKLVNNLLEFSRIEAGRVEAVYEPVDLSETTADLASSFRAAIEAAGLSFDVDCPPLPEPIYVDRDMWEKIVLNLLSNSFKFTFDGSIAVRLRERDGGIHLEVQDTGTGIEDHELPRLFERFHRIEGARSRSHEGSGIGLALIQELVRLHGGEIRVTSRPGAGTTVDVRIPRGSAHLPPSRVRATRSKPSTALGTRPFVDEVVGWGAGLNERDEVTALPPASEAPEERIVFADDNADMRHYVSRLLRERWDVEVFSNGAAALESIRRTPPALVLCDVMMPGLDGFALTRAVRADGATRAVPIIMLSARAGEEEAAKGRSTGANDYIAKPFSARELVVRVASVLSGRERAAFEERQRANLYRHFMQAPFPVAVFKGPRHVIELANPKVLRAWGVGAEVVGVPLVEALPVLRDQPFLGYLDEVFRTGTAYEGREELARVPTGPAGEIEEFYFNYVYAPLRDTKGDVEGILLSAFDVTQQVRARQEIDRALELLKEANDERSHALEEAVRANRAKDEFLATMSHELRTPLTAIVGWSKLLRTGNVAKEQSAKALETIERNARSQTRLIEDMLDLARVEQGKLVLSVGPTEMVRVVEAALEAVRPAAELKGVRLQQVLDSHATIVGDAERLQQVVWNLLSNAIKFTPRGGRVQVRLRRMQSYVELAVADDGLGIDASFLPHVFDRFRQADGRSSRKVGGLGLGLAIVRAIVELHGGVVTAQSDGLGQGATFSVRLPVAPLLADAGPSATEPEAAVITEPPAVLVGTRILVIDDEAATRDLLQFLLRQCGSFVSLAEDAPTALAAVRDGEFDLLISDVGMPDLDGYWLIRGVRDLPGKSALIPAVALTGYARTEDRTLALRAGFDVHLTKPIDPAELVVVVTTLLEGVRRRRG